MKSSIPLTPLLKLLFICGLLLSGGCRSLTVDTAKPPVLGTGKNIQATAEAAALARYTAYRERMKREFVAIGEGPGRSLVAHQVADGHIGWWADAMVVHGWYLAVLATEHNRAVTDEHRASVEEELRFALKAIDRVDLEAEPTLSGGKAERLLDGFFLRDDVDDSVLPHFTQPSKLDTIRSDYTHELKTHNGGAAMSQDQLISILFGLAMINRFCLEPDIQAQARDTFRRAYANVSENDWSLYMPRVKGEKKKPVPRGEIAKGLAAGLEDMADEVLKGEKLPGKPAPFYSHTIMSWARSSWIPKSYNQSMVLIVGAMSNCWGDGTQKALKRYERTLYPLLHSVYHGPEPKIELAYSRDYYLRTLAVAPDEGPHSEGPGGWDSWNRYYSPPADTKGWAFAGLDYMLLCNLYFMEFHPQSL